MDEVREVHLGANTFTNGDKNVYFLVYIKDAQQSYRNIDRKRIVELISLNFKGDYDWGQRLDYTAAVVMKCDDFAWFESMRK